MNMSKISDIDDKDLENTSIAIHDLLLIYIQKKMDATEQELIPYMANILDGGSGENQAEQLKRVELEALAQAYFEIKSTLWSIEFHRKNLKK
jgi:hypothetical protein